MFFFFFFFLGGGWGAGTFIRINMVTTMFFSHYSSKGDSYFYLMFASRDEDDSP